MTTGHDGEVHDRMEAVELGVARVLRVGVLIAAALIAAGLLIMATGILPDAGLRIVMAGLVVLVLTPILRVVGALWIFLRERDFIYAAFSVIVLLVLVAGMLLGHVEQ